MCPITPFWGGGPLGWDWSCPCVGTYPNELDRFTRLATIYTCPDAHRDRQKHDDNGWPIGFAERSAKNFNAVLVRFLKNIQHLSLFSVMKLCRPKIIANYYCAINGTNLMCVHDVNSTERTQCYFSMDSTDICGEHVRNHGDRLWLYTFYLFSMCCMNDNDRW